MSLSKEQVQETLQDLDALLSKIDTTLQPLLQKPLVETTKDLGAADNAKLQATLAYTMNTLFYLYLRLQNANLVGHPIVKDLERLKEYMKKVQQASAEQTLRLDKGAAKRFVAGALATKVKADEEPDVEEEEEDKPQEDNQ